MSLDATTATLGQELPVNAGRDELDVARVQQGA